MTDSGPDPVDEMLSAYLDGEATPEERARVESDPELLARVEALRAVAASVRAPLAGPSADVRRRQLDAALASVTPLAEVSSLDERRRHRRSTVRLAVLSAAAVLVLLALIAIPVLNSLGGDDDGVDTAAAPTEDALELEAAGSTDSGATAAEADRADEAEAFASGSAGGDGGSAGDTAADEADPGAGDRDDAAMADAAQPPAVEEEAAEEAASEETTGEEAAEQGPPFLGTFPDTAQLAAALPLLVDAEVLAGPDEVAGPEGTADGEGGELAASDVACEAEVRAVDPDAQLGPVVGLGRVQLADRLDQGELIVLVFDEDIAAVVAPDGCDVADEGLLPLE